LPPEVLERPAVNLPPLEELANAGLYIREMKKRVEVRNTGKIDAARGLEEKRYGESADTYGEELAHVVLHAGPVAAARDLSDQPPAAKWARNQGKGSVLMGADMGGRRRGHCS
jgi:hypothetical protein